MKLRQWIRLRVVALVTLAVLVNLRSVEAQPNDFVMISLGDSYAAGLGAPNVPTSGSQPPVWNDGPCHRSSHAPALLAATILGRLHDAVRLANDVDRNGNTTSIPHFACAGAQSTHLTGDAQTSGGTAINPPQIPAMAAWVKSKFPARRVVDALVISIGGNDVRFATIGQKCIASPAAMDCTQKYIGGGGLFPPLALVTNPEYAMDDFTQGFSALTQPGGRLDQLINTINSLPTVQDDVQVKNVYLTGYPDLPRDGSNQLCDQLFGDMGWFYLAESTWTSQVVIAQLNQALRDAVRRANLSSKSTRWHFIDVVPRFVNHGICADPGARFVNTFSDSRATHADPTLTSASCTLANLPFQPEGCGGFGTAHPNDFGYNAIADAITAAVNPLFFITQPTVDALLSSTAITLLWSDPSGNADFFKLQYSVGTGGIKISLPVVRWNQLRRASIPNPIPGQTYTVEITSCSEVSIGYAERCSPPAIKTIVFPLAPAPPSNFKISAQRVNPLLVGYSVRYTFNWVDNATNETYFEIQQQEAAAAPWTVYKNVPANSAVTYGTDEQVTSYAYRVRACHEVLCSVFSNTVIRP